MLNTSAITLTLLSPNSKAIAGARITATLTQMDTAALSGMVFPREVEATTGEDGKATLSLWPNTEGVTGSQYRFRAWHPTTGRKLLDELATVPEHDANLRDILLLPAPTKKPYDEASIAAIQEARTEAIDAANQAESYLEAVENDAQAAQQAASEASNNSDQAQQAASYSEQDRIAAEQAAVTAGNHAAIAGQQSANAIEAADAAEDAQQASEDARDSASGHRLTAQNAAENALYSANQAGIARQGVEDLRDQAAQSAHDASLAQNHASQAMHQANQSAVNAATNKNLSHNYAQQSKDHRDKAKDYRESARRWAQEKEDVPVLNEDGEVPQYSAMHWARKALLAATSSPVNDDITTTGNLWSAAKTNLEISQAETRSKEHTDSRETAIRSDMVAADNQLQSNIDAEEQARIFADNQLQENLDAESQQRQLEDSQLAQAIQDESSRAQQAEQALQENLDDETQARQDADDAIQLQITNFQSYADETYFKKQGGHIGGNVSIEGNLTVQGETVQVDSQISTADRVINVNAGEVGAGVTGGFAGLEVDRGTEDNYEFGFNENTGYFELGKQGNRQPAMTREVTPADGKVLKWNAANKRAEASDLTWQEIANKPDLVTEQQFSSLLTGLKDSFVSGKQSIDAVS